MYISFFTDNKIYKLACEYMAKTELFDRSLSSAVPSKYDKTAVVLLNHIDRRSSITYAAQLMNKICQDNHILNFRLFEEIHKHHYTAQYWIDEWERIRKLE